MKKLLMIALFAIVAVGASAQKGITVWWGGNIADVGGDIKADAAFKALNIGVAYTAPITDEFDWSAGLSYATKGCENWDPGFLQIEGNGAWNFVNNGDAKVGIFTGPYLAFMVAKDEDALGALEANSFDFGWQGGLTAGWKFLAFKLGYEYGFCNIIKDVDSKSGDFFIRVGVRF